jgi:hypothetical protein
VEFLFVFSNHWGVHAIWMHAEPSGAQIPQLELQQYSWAPQFLAPHFGPLSGTHEHVFCDQTWPWMQSAVCTHARASALDSSLCSLPWVAPPHATRKRTSDAMSFFTISPWKNGPNGSGGLTDYISATPSSSAIWGARRTQPNF